MLGQNESKSPNRLKFDNKIISNPMGLADAFNKIFQDKIKNFREKN